MDLKLVTLLAFMLSLISGCIDTTKKVSAIDIKQQEAAAIERGRQVVKTLGCNFCHTPDFMVKRSTIPEDDWLVGSSVGFFSPSGTTYPTNLRLLLNNMTENEWLVLARQMRQDSPMSWIMLPDTAEQDLRAIYKFVHYLGPKGSPAPPPLPAGVAPTTQYIESPDPH